MSKKSRHIHGSTDGNKNQNLKSIQKTGILQTRRRHTTETRQTNPQIPEKHVKVEHTL